MDQTHMTPARIRQAKVEQTVLQHHFSDDDGLALEQGEIGDPEHAGGVLLQKQHLPRWGVQRYLLLNAVLKGALAPIPLLIREGPLQVHQLCLGFELRRLLEHRH